jgi:hypothetical protein
MILMAFIQRNPATATACHADAIRLPSSMSWPAAALARILADTQSAMSEDVIRRWEGTHPAQASQAPACPGKPDQACRVRYSAQGWTFRTLAENLSDASSGICDVPDVESIIPQIRRWERGAAGIGEHYQTLYCVAFEMGMELFTISPGHQ